MKTQTLVGLALVLMGCGEGGLPPTAPPPPPVAPPALTILSGNDQEGMAGQFLKYELAVWIGVSGARGAFQPVQWRVVSGAGHFAGAFPTEYGVTRTSAWGIAYVYLQPTSPGPITVVAEVTGGSRATFTAFATPGPVMEVISGNGQLGVTAAFLGSPLVVRVTDIQGHPLPGLLVNWSIASGSGDLGAGERCGETCRSTRTDAAGFASIAFEPWNPGQTRVIAEIPAAQGSPAFFEVSATGLPTVMIRFGPWEYCEEGSYFQLPTTSIPSGTQVIFQNSYCFSQVLSKNVPPGAGPFDSGILTPGARYAIIVTKPGLWVFEDAANGGSGAFTVVP